MAKKKKTPVAQIEPISLPDEDLAKARAWLEGLNADIAYSQAKRQLAEACGWERSKSNAVIVALHEEGFMAGEKNYFCNPNAPAEPGVVRGAREVSNFTIMLQSDPEVSVPLPYAIHCLPGDVFMLRKTVTGNWRVSNFVARHQTRWVCKLRGRIRRGRRSGIAQVVPINGFAPVEMQMDLADVPAEVDLEKAAFEVEFLPESMKPEPYVEIFVRFVKEIGNRFDPLGEIAIASAEYDLPVEFSAAALDEAQALPDEVDPKNMGRRVDLRDIPFVTIDGEDARDFDDAVYCARVEDGRTRLLVAIADVSHYVKPGAPLDVDAQQRATSVYFPASVVPMLPEKLSNGLCSLNPGVDRLTMVCDAVIDPEGRTEAYQFYPAVIHSHARLTYTQVWGAMQGEEGGLAAVGDRLDDIR
ncbi:MAG: RNB domain-containing ribonuclease, partial [Sutterella wadsworthensis]